MDAFTNALWAALPSVAAVEKVEEREGAKAACGDVLALLMAMHKACTGNATQEDSAKEAAAALPKGDLPCDLGTVKALLRDVVVAKWLPQPAKLEAALTELLECVVDDRTNQLSKYEEVITRRGAGSIDTPFANYVTLAQFAPHDPAYDALWQGLQPDPSGTITLEKFLRFFNSIYKSLYSNATDKRGAVAAAQEWYNAIAATGRCGFDEFCQAAKRIAALYAKRSDCDAFYSSFVASATQAAPNGDIYAAQLLPKAECLLSDRSHSRKLC